MPTWRFCPFTLPTFYTTKEGQVRHYWAWMQHHLSTRHSLQLFRARKHAQRASSVPPRSPFPEEAPWEQSIS